MLFQTYQKRQLRCNDKFRTEPHQIGECVYLGTVIRGISTGLRQRTHPCNQYNVCHSPQRKMVSPIHSQSLERTVNFTPRFNKQQNQCTTIQAPHANGCKMIDDVVKSVSKVYGNTKKCISYKNIKVQQRRKQQKERRFHTSYCIKNKEENVNKLILSSQDDCNQSKVHLDSIQTIANEQSSKRSISIILQQFLQMDRELHEYDGIQNKNGVQLFYEHILGKHMRTVQSLESLLPSCTDSLNYSNVQSLQFSFLIQ